MHASFFEYNITRPYPHRWFTPVVLVLGVIAVVLLSLLNFTSSGFILNTQYSNDPNVTSAFTLLNGWPSFLRAKLQPSCESTNIPVDTKLLTSNSALTYTLTNVWHDKGTIGQSLSSSLLYHNNLLPNCTVDYIALHLNARDRTAAQVALSNWGVTAEAYLTCSLNTEDQRNTSFSLIANYNYMPETVSIYTGFYNFVGRNQTTKSSLYWGESLLSMYWLALARAFDGSPLGAGPKPTLGTITFTPNGSVTDPLDLKYFSVLYRFVVPESDNSHYIVYADNVGVSGWLLSADVLAKSLYSTVLVDLGQRSTPANILTNATLLEYFTANFSKMYADGVDRSAPARVPFKLSNNTGGPLVSVPSTLAATYLCQTPQQKPVGNVLLGILLADLVFLQALWLLTKISVDAYTKYKDKNANFCDGCRGRMPYLETPVASRSRARDDGVGRDVYGAAPYQNFSTNTVIPRLEKTSRISARYEIVPDDDEMRWRMSIPVQSASTGDFELSPTHSRQALLPGQHCNHA